MQELIKKLEKQRGKKINEFNKEDWHLISRNQILSEDFIREYQDKVDWVGISANQKLSEEFIREFKHKVYWDYISRDQKLSEEFIREYQDKVEWYWISRFQILSEDFIREFKDKVWWYYISINQKLSEEFIREFQNSVNTQLELETQINYLYHLYEGMTIRVEKEGNLIYGGVLDDNTIDYILDELNVTGITIDEIDDKFVFGGKRIV